MTGSCRARDWTGQCRAGVFVWFLDIRRRAPPAVRGRRRREALAAARKRRMAGTGYLAKSVRVAATSFEARYLRLVSPLQGPARFRSWRPAGRTVPARLRSRAGSRLASASHPSADGWGLCNGCNGSTYSMCSRSAAASRAVTRLFSDADLLHGGSGLARTGWRTGWRGVRVRRAVRRCDQRRQARLSTFGLNRGGFEQHVTIEKEAFVVEDPGTMATIRVADGSELELADCMRQQAPDTMQRSG